MNFARYRQIILADCRNPKYPFHRKLVWSVFGFFGMAFIAIYILFFHENLGSTSRLFLNVYRSSITSHNESFKQLVYMYNYVLVALVFFCIVLVFGLFAFFACDMQARNEVIRSLLENKEPDSSEHS